MLTLPLEFVRAMIPLLRPLSRWMPERDQVVVCDSSLAALDLLASVRETVCVVTRLRLDA
jgi:hypothetical protein